MAEEMKKIDNEELEKVDGGMAAAYRRLHQDVDSLIPSEVKEILETAKSDVEVCRILAENGIDVEEEHFFAHMLNIKGRMEDAKEFGKKYSA